MNNKLILEKKKLLMRFLKEYDVYNEFKYNFEEFNIKLDVKEYKINDLIKTCNEKNYNIIRFAFPPSINQIKLWKNMTNKWDNIINNSNE